MRQAGRSALAGLLSGAGSWWVVIAAARQQLVACARLLVLAEVEFGAAPPAEELQLGMRLALRLCLGPVRCWQARCASGAGSR